MPYQYVRDDPRRRIRIRFRDPLTTEELVETADRQVAEGVWSYSVLVDARGLSSKPDIGRIRTFLSHVKQLVTQHGPRGPLAIVVRESGGIAGAQIYKTLGGTNAEPELTTFWDVDEAERWLDRMVRAESH